MTGGGAVTVFLGEAATRGPLALLGLSIDRLAEEDVLAALDRRLSQVNEHSQRDTPAADEVRLALHAAAAQLLDARVVRLLRERASQKSTPVPPAEPLPRPVPPRIEPPRVEPAPSDDFDAEVRGVLGASGGLTRDALQRVRALGALRGLGVDDVVRAVVRAGSRPATATTAERSAGGPTMARATAPSAGTDEPVPEWVALRQRGPRPWPWVLAAIGVVGVLGAGMVIMSSGPRAAVAPRAPETPASQPWAELPAAVGGAPEARSASEQGRQSRVQPAAADVGRATGDEDISALVADVRQLAELVEPGGAEALAARVEAVVPRLARVWPRVPSDQLAACTDAVVEALYRCGEPTSAGERAAGAVLGAVAIWRDGAPGEPLAAAWSAGMARRLSREQDLPAGVRERVAAANAWIAGEPGGATEASFEAGLAWAMGRWPAIAATGREPVERWQAWSVGADAIGIAAPLARGPLVLAALEEALAGDQPREVISELVRRLDWREGDPARGAALRWLRDSRVPSGAAGRLVAVLLNSSGVSGLDATMTLPTSPSAEQRAQLAERLAAAWGLEATSAVIDAARERWAVAAREALAETPSDDLSQLAMAARLALINEGAAWIWRGESVRGLEMAEAAGATMAGVLQPRAAVGDESVESAWAASYAAARGNPKERRVLLEQAVRGGPIGTTDAEMIVGEWASGTGEIRDLAASAIRRHAATGAMALAMLERAPRLPRTRATVDLVEVVSQRRLPSTRSPGFAIALRRALVERALDVLAGEGGTAAPDRVARQIAVAYRGLGASTPLTVVERDEPIQPVASGSASRAWERWRGELRASVVAGSGSGVRWGVEALERRRLARLGSVRSELHAFAAEQVSLSELLSSAIEAQRPEVAARAREVVDEMLTARRRARTLQRQMMDVEGAMTRLWLLRLGVDEGSVR